MIHSELGLYIQTDYISPNIIFDIILDKNHINHFFRLLTPYEFFKKKYETEKQLCNEIKDGKIYELNSLLDRFDTIGERFTELYKWQIIPTDIKREDKKSVFVITSKRWKQDIYCIRVNDNKNKEILEKVMNVIRKT